jgi:SnoaL-like domain
MTTEVDLRAVADRQEIHEVLMRYCRGIDRGDPEVLSSVYHEGAVDRHGPFQFTDAQTEMAKLTIPRLDALRGVAQHHITNYLIELHGDTAEVESYFLAFQPTKLDDDSEVLALMGGRYLDRFERRDGRWGIIERSVVVDWSRAELQGEDWPAAKDFPPPGRRESDPSHALFASGVLA